MGLAHSGWAMNQPAKKITRGELCERVWTTPIVKLATLLSALSDDRVDLAPLTLNARAVTTLLIAVTWLDEACGSRDNHAQDSTKATYE